MGFSGRLDVGLGDRALAGGAHGSAPQPIVSDPLCVAGCSVGIFVGASGQLVRLDRPSNHCGNAGVFLPSLVDVSTVGRRSLGIPHKPGNSATAVGIRAIGGNRGRWVGSPGAAQFAGRANPCNCCSDCQHKHVSVYSSSSRLVVA